MSRLGQHLLARGLVTDEQLDEALGHQAVQGARLGTNLVELGFITIEQLAESLADFHGVPLPERKWLQKPQRAAVQRVTRALVERIRFIPLRLEGKVLHAALLDPRNPNVLDDLRFATGCRIQPYVLPEVWIHDWLLELFQLPRGMRQVVSRSPSAAPAGPELNAHRPDAPPQFETTAMSHAHAAVAAAKADARRHAHARPPAPPAPQPRRSVAPAPRDGAARARVSAPPALPAAARSSGRPPSMRVRTHAALSPIETTSWALPAAPVSSPPPSPAAELRESAPVELPEASIPAPPALPDSEPSTDPLLTHEPADEPTLPALEPLTVARELSHWESALRQASDRERLIELAFSIAGCFATRVALFTVNQGMIQGHRCLERGLPHPVDGVVVPLDAASMLAEVVARAEATRADPRLRELDRRVRELLCDQQADEVALFPVAIKQRVVNVLYASNADEPLGPIAFGALALVAQEMGLAYGRLILARKAGSSAG